RQADRAMQWSWLGYSWTKPVAILRTLRLNFNQWWGWNFGGETLFAGGNINGGGQLKNFWHFWGGIGREGKNLSVSALRGGPAMRFPANLNNWYNLSTDGRKSIQFGIGGFNSWADDGGSRRNNFRFWVRYRPMDGLQLRVNPFYTFNKRDLQYIDTLEYLNQDRFLFGTIDQKTLGITIRLDYSITPDLSIQYYGQPFISAGRYSEFKRITEPRAIAYDDRFHIFSDTEVTLNDEDAVYEFDEDLDGVVDYSIDEPDFNFRQFRSNLVVRWEYSPGSTVFLVWTQERTGDDVHGRFSVRDGFNELFEDDARNVFLIKVSRWFSL
ncbi:DUF5916 domain-containing protein, partial [bacterium]|nr:DUF5916 domain-containing protein [bacterium]